MSKLRPARKGLSYYDANRHALIEVTGEALEVKRRILERWPQLDVWFDKDDLKFVVTQMVEEGPDKGTEKLVMKTSNLEKMEQWLTEADPTHRNYRDPLEVMDEHQAKHDKEEADRLADIVGDAGQRLIHAFKKDGLHDHLNIYGPRPKRHLSRRAIRAGR